MQRFEYKMANGYKLEEVMSKIDHLSNERGYRCQGGISVVLVVPMRGTEQPQFYWSQLMVKTSGSDDALNPDQ